MEDFTEASGAEDEGHAGTSESVECAENDGENGLSTGSGDMACRLGSRGDDDESSAKRHAPGASSAHAKLVPAEATLATTTRFAAAHTVADRSDADWARGWCQMK